MRRFIKDKLIKPPDMLPNRRLFPGDNPFFTPWYLNNLLEANNNQVNGRVISHIRDLHPNINFREIMNRNPWAQNRLMSIDNNSMAYTVAMNPNHMLYHGPFPNDLNNVYLVPEDYPDEIPEEINIRHNEDPYTGPPGGPTGSGIKQQNNNKWINHVKSYSKKNNIPYNIALKEAKKTYNKKKG